MQQAEDPSGAPGRRLQLYGLHLGFPWTALAGQEGPHHLPHNTRTQGPKTTEPIVLTLPDTAFAAAVAATLPSTPPTLLLLPPLLPQPRVIEIG